MNEQEGELLKQFRALNSESRRSLLDFAAYLFQRQGGAVPRRIEEPRQIERPEDESVVAAMRRLRETYPMLDAAHLLHRAAGLLAEHTLQGRSAESVIDELEHLFAEQYQRVKSELENP
ncbi:MAG: hypothetical protein Kow006_01680 [Gammaproteobacteria bacterium]